MIAQVHIQNFKSIRNLSFTAKRVNVFIGEPNAGKSNILEALAVSSEGLYDDRDIFRDVLRFKSPSDLLFDRDLSEIAEVTTSEFRWSLKFEGSWFRGRYSKPGVPQADSFTLDHAGNFSVSQFPETTNRYYRFKTLQNFADSRPGVLRAPYGSNLVALLTTNKRLRRLVSDLFRARGFRLVIDAERGELIMAKEVDDQLYNFSYPTVSETLRRIVFFMAVLETNENSILLLDEPEANTFPFYTTYLAERIALDETNQFFLTTHNPYILGSLVGKTQTKDLAVFVTEMKAYQTRLKPVTPDGLSKIMDYGPDAFLNLEHLTE
jgi:hypothetical protein